MTQSHHDNPTAAIERRKLPSNTVTCEISERLLKVMEDDSHTILTSIYGIQLGIKHERQRERATF